MNFRFLCSKKKTFALLEVHGTSHRARDIIKFLIAQKIKFSWNVSKYKSRVSLVKSKSDISFLSNRKTKSREFRLKKKNLYETQVKENSVNFKCRQTRRKKEKIYSFYNTYFDFIDDCNFPTEVCGQKRNIYCGIRKNVEFVKWWLNVQVRRA